MGKSFWGVLAAALIIGMVKVVPYLIREAVIDATNVQPIELKPTTIPTFDSQKLLIGVPTKKQVEARSVTPVLAKSPALVRQWSAPSESKFKPDDLLNPGRIEDLAFDRAGARLVTI